MRFSIKRFPIAAFAASAALLAASSVLAQEAATPAAANAAKLDPDEIVCKSTPPMTGTRIGGRRICMTRAKWDQRQKNSQGSLSNMQLNGLHNPIKQGG